jgi:Flp pilus assembly protein TadG
MSLLSKFAPARIRRFTGNESGTTAIEFAAVIGPFLMLLFGIISVGFYFFVVFSLEHAVESAARVIRTGQAQTSSPPMTVTQFKQLVCDKLPPFMATGSCANLRVNVQNFAGYGSISTASCLDGGGSLIPAANQTFNTGSANAVVLVSVCFEWELTQSMASIPYWISPRAAQMGNGSTLIQASAAFTTEPYN